MPLTSTTASRPATDLGHLLAKNPARAQSFPLAWGTAHVVYRVHQCVFGVPALESEPVDPRL